MSRGLCESCVHDEEATHEVVFVRTPNQVESIPFKACQPCAEFAELKAGARIRPFQEEAHDDENHTAVPQVLDQDPPTLPAE